MRLQAIVLAFAASISFAGCATFSLTGQEAVIQQDESSTEAIFRRGAEEFQTQFSDAGWLREEESQGRAKAMLSILSKGWAHIKGDDDQPQNHDSVALYLQRISALSGDDPTAQAIDIQRDISLAFLAMVELNALAEPVVEQAGTSPAQSIRTDVMVLERALISANKAHSLFTGAAERIAEQLDEASLALMTTQLQNNAREIGRLKVFADTLNTYRMDDNPIG